MSDGGFNKYCEALLAKYNRRDTEAIRRHVESLCDFLRQEGNHVVQTMFGGSVMRRTYVNGLSDVDVLLIVNQSSLVNQPPEKVIAYARDTIKRRLPNNSVSAGDLAVKVNYSDGSEIQILPAIRTKSGGIRIAQPGSAKWSNVARPDIFAKKLIEVNNARGGRVVPVIKLAKAMADCHIPSSSSNISGYHMESLAIEAFRGYNGSRDSKTMLNHLFGNSIKAVKSPITDSTGQSRYVDEYLGPAESRPRKGASTHFGQMRGKVNSCKTKKEFDSLFCEGSANR